MDSDIKKSILGKIHEIQVEMLIFIDNICRENNITYHLYTGSLLGAVRHKGFIPWDDDIDICMTRENYDKFIRVFKENESNKYCLEIPNYKSQLHIGKIRKLNTQLFEFTTPEDSNAGIYIDIFPLDNSKPMTRSGKNQEIRLFYLFRLKGMMYPTILTHVSSKWKTAIKYLTFLLLFPFRIVYTREKLYRKIEKTA